MREELVSSPFFSVIVPVYNSEKYLRECIESVIEQDFDDWELILVDDGSSDNSGSICDYYTKRDKRIIAIHKENGGEFLARKTGLDKAKGRFIVGLDSDDYFMPNHLGVINKALVKHKVDCVSFPLKFVGDLKGLDNPILPCDREVDGYIFLIECLKKTCSFCNKAIRKTCFEQVDYSDAPMARFSEDEMMVLPALCHVRSACCIEDHFYCYRIHEGSASAKKTYMHVVYRDMVISYDIKKMKEAGLYSEGIEKILIMQFLHMLNTLTWDMFINKQWKKEMKDSIKNLSMFKLAKNGFNPQDYDIKECIRIKLILNGHFWIMSLLAGIIRPIRGRYDKK